MSGLSTHETTTLLLAVAALLAGARSCGELARRVGLPAVVGEIVGGVLLGPTVLGRLAPSVADALFPSSGPAAVALDGLVSVAVVLFLLVAGLEIDLSRVLSLGRKAFAISVSGIVVPFALGLGVAWIVPAWVGAEPGTDRWVFAVFVGTALSISALPLIARTLMDLGLYRTELGLVTMAAAVVNDLVGWLVFAVLLATLGVGGSGLPVEVTVGVTLLFVALLLTLGRSLIDRALPWVEAHSSGPGAVLSFALVLTLGAAAASEWMGVHAILGALLVGIAIGDSAHLRRSTRATIGELTSHLFAPLFFGSIGLKVDFAGHLDVGLCLGVLLLATAGKVLGGLIGARLGGMGVREGWAVAFGLNARGAMEIVLGLLALEIGLIGERLFVALVVMALATSVASGVVLERIVRRARPLGLDSMLDPSRFVERLAASTRWEAIAELAAVAAPATGLEARAIAAAARDRERVLSTGLANRIAVPNARLEGLAAPVVALGLSRRGIDFDAADGQLAQIVVLVLLPSDDEETGLRLFADVAEAFARPEVRARMLSAGRYTEVLGALRDRGDGASEEPEGERRGWILVGAGPLARVWCRALSIAGGAPAWLIDTDRSRIERARAEGIAAVRGSALHEATLHKAEAFAARGLIALTPNPDTNAEIASYARSRFRIPDCRVLGPVAGLQGPRAVDIAGPQALASWDEVLARGPAEWARVEVDRPRELDAALRPPVHAEARAFLPLVVERASGRVEPAGSGLGLGPGDVVSGILAPELAPELERRVSGILEEAPLLYVDGEAHSPELELDTVLARAAEVLSSRLPMSPVELRARLASPEVRCGVPLGQRAALVHVRLDAPGLLELAVARAPAGLRLEGSASPVETLFVIVAGRDENALHLAVLARIAGLVRRTAGTGLAAAWPPAAADEPASRDVALGRGDR